MVIVNYLILLCCNAKECSSGMKPGIDSIEKYVYTILKEKIVFAKRTDSGQNMKNIYKADYNTCSRQLNTKSQSNWVHNFYITAKNAQQIEINLNELPKTICTIFKIELQWPHYWTKEKNCWKCTIKKSATLEYWHVI